MPPSAPSPSSVLRPRSPSHPAGPCPSPSDRRRQSPNKSPPPERARDRRGRRGVEGEECGGVSAGGMAYAPPVRRRAFRVRSPMTPRNVPERGAEAADTRRKKTGLRALCREYPSNCCPQTDADSRLRGAGQIRICQSRVRREVARFGDNVGACPAERPAGPCRQTHSVHPQIFTKCQKFNSSFIHFPAVCLLSSDYCLLTRPFSGFIRGAGFVTLKT